MKTKQIIFTIILLIVFALLTALYIKKSEKIDEIVEVEETIKTDVVSQKTYQNTVYNYSVNYPSNWYIDTRYADQELIKQDSDQTVYSGGNLSISNYSDDSIDLYQKENGPLEFPKDYMLAYVYFEKIDSNTSLDKFIKTEDIEADSVEVEQMILNGTPALKYTLYNISGIGGATKGNSVIIVSKNNDKLLTISYGFDDLNKSVIPEVEKIVDSFMFVK